MPQKRKLSAVPCSVVRFDGGFWKSRIETNESATLPHLYALLRDGGRFALQTGAQASAIGYKMYWETEIARFVEAASYCLSRRYDGELDALVDEIIGIVASAQQPDGYLNAFITFTKPDKRWRDLFACHELYNAGALAEAAAAHFRATGKRTLLDPVCRYIDYIDSCFGPEEGKLKGYCGHPGVEMGLASLFRATGTRRYLDLSRFFVEQRGRLPNWFDSEESGDTALHWVESLRNFYLRNNRDFHEFNQSHLPARRQREAVGHAVRAMYFYSGMADIAREYGDGELMDACEAIWADVFHRKMYVTGGVGSEYDIEGFGPAYYLPNRGAYAETCAAAGLVFFSHRMLQMTGEGKYADAVERVLYNLLPASVSLDGKAFFYQNPQQSDGDDEMRQPQYTCACCPTNAARVISGLGGYFYSCGGGSIYVNQYAASAACIRLGGHEVMIEQHTEYPWNGRIEMKILPDKPAAFTLCLRLPAWCGRHALALNGESRPPGRRPVDGYVKLRRLWQAGDTVTLDLEMPVQRVRAHPMVTENIGKTALMRGPVVYCLEETDNLEDMDLLRIPEESSLHVEYRKDMLGGVCVITGNAEKLCRDGWEGKLYRAAPAAAEPFRFTAIPYAVWGNRGGDAMRVWMRN